MEERNIQIFAAGNDFDVIIGKDIKFRLSALEMESFLSQAPEKENRFNGLERKIEGILLTAQCNIANLFMDLP